MSDIFESLPSEKKQKILNACIEEFSAKGYENASTNIIVKNAGISKGTLFNYFGNKKSLFLYIFDYSIKYLIDKFNSVKDDLPADLFERFVYLSLYKMKVFLEDSSISKLVVSALTNMPLELKEELAKRYSVLYSQNTPLLFEGIDTSIFREGIDVQKTLELITFFWDGLSNKYLAQYKGRSADEIFDSMERIIEEFNKYLEILKYGMCNSTLSKNAP